MAISKRSAVIAAVTVLLFAACAPAQAPTSTPTAAPTLTPTLRPTATPLPMVTATPVSPAPQPTPTPTRAAEQPKRGGRLVLPIREDPISWDPHVTHVDATAETTSMVFVGLIKGNATPDKQCQNVFVPFLAQSWKWVTDTTLEFQLREGVKFQNKPPVNAREMTAEDVAFSFRRIKETLPVAKPFTDHISSIEAKGKYTVQFKTDIPFPALVSDFFGISRGAFVVAPEAAVGGKYEDPAKTHMGNGPFLFSKHIPGVRIEYARNPDYFVKDLPYVDAVAYQIIPDMSTRLAALRTGQLSLVKDVPPAPLLDMKRTAPNLRFIVCEGFSPEHIYMRTDLPPFNDVRVRRAVAMAINRKGMIEAIFGGFGRVVPVLPTTLPTAMKLEDFPPEIRKYVEYRPEEARALLREAAPGGLKVQLRGTPRYPSPYPELIQAAAADLKAAGFDISIFMQEYGAYSRSVVADGEYPSMALTHGRIEAEAYAKGYLGFHSESGWGNNRSHVTDPKLDRMIDQWLVTLDEKQRKDLGWEIQRLVVEQAYRVILPAPDDSLITRPEVMNVAFRASERIVGPWLETIWLAQ